MTGHGEALCRAGKLSVGAEIRTVNNRYLKTTIRLSDGMGALESRVDELIKAKINRGSVYVQVRVEREPTADDFQVNTVVLNSYRDQLKQSFPGWGDDATPELLLRLPGVIKTAIDASLEAEDAWPLIETAISQSLERLQQMRLKEGAEMAQDLHSNCTKIAAELAEIESRAPLVVSSYQTRLTERMNQLLAEHEVKIEPQDLVREVGLFADRCDISEEIVRLKSHLKQFDSIISGKTSEGKKLDFVTQEMFRETNTIGSKANDSEIARHVIEIKTLIERIREMVQNVE